MKKKNLSGWAAYDSPVCTYVNVEQEGLLCMSAFGTEAYEDASSGYQYYDDTDTRGWN